MAGFKNGKIMLPIKEFLIVKEQSSYELNMIDMSKVTIFYRKYNKQAFLETYQVMPKGDYRVNEVGGNKKLEITNLDILDEYYSIQLCRVVDLKASPYNPSGEIDVITLNQHLNEVVSDITFLFTYLKDVGMVMDSSGGNKILAELKPFTTWFMDENGDMAAMPVNSLFDGFNQLVESLRKEISVLLQEDYQKLSNLLTTETNKHIQTLKDKLDELLIQSKQQLDEYTLQKIEEIKNACEQLLTLKYKLFKADTIEQLKNMTFLQIGEVVEVLGYYNADDGATHKRIITQEDDGSGVQLANGLWANIVHNGGVNVAWFGAKGDAITDDTESIQKAINVGRSVSFGQKKYAILNTVMLKKRQVINGNGAVIHSKNDISVFKLSDSNIISDLIFDNNNSKIGTALDLTSEKSEMMTNPKMNNQLNNIQIHGFKNGLLFGNTVGDHSGNQLNSILVKNCEVGFNVGERGEFNTFTNCTATGCNIGLLIIGGNTHYVGGNITNNNIGIKIAKGQNDAHGLVSSTSIKHNTQYAIVIDSINVGEFLFTDISLYYGDIWLKNCQGVRFFNSVLDTCKVIEENAINCKFKNIGCFTKPLSNEPNKNNKQSFVIYKNVENKGEVTSANNLNGGAFRGLISENIPVHSDSNGEIKFYIVYNSICKNFNFTYYKFYDTVTNILDLSHKISFGWYANIEIQVAVASIENQSIADADFNGLDIYLEEETNKPNKRRYFLNKSVRADRVTEKTKPVYIYTLTGRIMKARYKVKYSNTTGKNFFIPREQQYIDTEINIPGFIEITDI